MSQPPAILGLMRRRIVVAPMAGGPTTAGPVIVAEPSGVNVFVPGRPCPPP